MSENRGAPQVPAPLPPRYTPGPWLYRPHKFDDWGVVRDANGHHMVAVARAGREQEVDGWNAHRNAGTDPFEANGRLIAAAPDLLDALSELMTQHEQFRDYFEPVDRAAMILARAAIAKASAPLSQTDEAQK